MVTSYGIDESCSKKGVDGDIREAMTSAFEMVDSALRHINQDEYDPDTFELIKRLFMPNEGQDPKDKDKLGKVKSIFENIIKNYRNERSGPSSQVPSKDIVSLSFNIWLN